MRKSASLPLVVVLLLGAAVSGWAQESAPSQEPADLVAYRPIYDSSTPAAKKIDLSEAFLAETRSEFLASTYRDYVFVILYRTYKEEKNWLKALDLVDRLEKLVPKTPAERRVAYYDEAMRIANIQRADIPKTIEYAEKIIAIEPNNVHALQTLASAIPTLPNDPAAQEPVLMKIVGYGRKFLTLDKPAAVPDDQWRETQKTIRVQSQGLVALIQLIKKDYVECIKAYEELIKLTPKDAAAQYRLGICHYYLVQQSNKLYVDKNEEYRDFVNKCNDEKNCEASPDKEKSITEYEDKVAVLKKDFEQKRDKAIDAFARSVAIGGTGPEPAAARFELEKLYKTITNPPPPVALDDFIAQKKRELGV